MYNRSEGNLMASRLTRWFYIVTLVLQSFGHSMIVLAPQDPERKKKPTGLRLRGRRYREMECGEGTRENA